MPNPHHPDEIKERKRKIMHVIKYHIMPNGITRHFLTSSGDDGCDLNTITDEAVIRTSDKFGGVSGHRERHEADVRRMVSALEKQGFAARVEHDDSGSKWSVYFTVKGDNHLDRLEMAATDLKGSNLGLDGKTAQAGPQR